jgi:hypothetical protein
MVLPAPQVIAALPLTPLLPMCTSEPSTLVTAMLSMVAPE